MKFEAFVREGKRKTLSLMHNVEYKIGKSRMKGILSDYDPSVTENTSPERKKTVAFIITRMVRFHGGQTSVLRLGTQLARQGFKVIYLVYKPQSVKEMKYCASSNLSGYEGMMAGFDSFLKDLQSGKHRCPDIVFATSWDTVSYAKKLEKAYKMYFVQDYEPYFYKFGEEFLLCKSTYEQGLHMVSLGAWNKEMIERECKPLSPIDVIDFPCEKSEYPYLERDFEAYRGKRRLTLAVYMKFYGKRLPNLIPHMLVNTAEKLKKQGIELEVLYFGEAGTFSAAGGRNLGQLSKKELCELYHRADFGMVASMSNISLVPFEMHAAGLPVIEFEDGTYPYFFPENTALFTKISAEDISELLLGAMNNPERLKEMHDRAAEYMEALSWENTGAQCARIIRQL